MVENTVLISLHPKHAKRILSGEKKLEFRRVWAQKPVSKIVIYATAPVKRIVAVARVKAVHSGSATKLWGLCKATGGALTRRELYAYFKGKKNGYAIEIGDVTPLQPALDPKLLIENFVPPQSLQYLPELVSEMIFGKAKEKKGKVFFIGGVHGVGKTTLCESIASEAGLVHKSAGQLIKEADPEALSAHSKLVRDPVRNQRLLVDQVAKIISSGITLLLDGHFTLLKSDGSIEPLPMSIFQDLGVSGIVVLSDDVDCIIERLTSRDGSVVTVDSVKQQQDREIEAAQLTADFLNVHLHHYHASAKSEKVGILTVVKSWHTGAAL